MRTIDTTSLAILERGRTEGCLYFLPGEQLERKQYEAVNKVLEALGGKWSRKDRAHRFEFDASEVVETALTTGTYTNAKQALGFFETPESVTRVLVCEADIEPDLDVLEPSAGRGAIAAFVKAQQPQARVFCIEIDPTRCRELAARGFSPHQGDFLTFDAGSPPVYDRVVMNPPFAAPGHPQADIAHVLHAHRWLKPGGRLVSVMSAGVRFRENRKAVEFREFVAAQRGRFVDLPETAFTECDLDVRTCYVVMEAPR